MSFCLVAGIEGFYDNINITGTLECLINKEITYHDRIWIDYDTKTIWVDHIYRIEFICNLYCEIKGRKCRDSDTVKYFNGYKVILIL